MSSNNFLETLLLCILFLLSRIFSSDGSSKSSQTIIVGGATRCHSPTVVKTANGKKGSYETIFIGAQEECNSPTKKEHLQPEQVMPFLAVPYPVTSPVYYPVRVLVREQVPVPVPIPIRIRQIVRLAPLPPPSQPTIRPFITTTPSPPPPPSPAPVTLDPDEQPEKGRNDPSQVAFYLDYSQQYGGLVGIRSIQDSLCPLPIEPTPRPRSPWPSSSSRRNYSNWLNEQVSSLGNGDLPESDQHWSKSSTFILSGWSEGRVSE